MTARSAGSNTAAMISAVMAWLSAIDVREDRHATGHRHAGCGGDEAARRDDDLVARLQADRVEGHVKRHGAVGKRDRMPAAEMRCIGLLEFAHLACRSRR